MGNALGIPLIALATTFCLPWLMADEPSLGRRLLAHPVLVWLGRRSYGIYLLHYPVWLLVRHAGMAVLPTAGVSVAVALTLAALSFRWIECPMLDWRDRRIA